MFLHIMKIPLSVISEKNVYTAFSQPIKFKLGTQTFIQHTLCQHNILPVYTVLTQCLYSDSDCILS